MFSRGCAAAEEEDDTEYKIQADKNNSHMPPAYQEEKHKQINNSITNKCLISKV